MRDQGPQMRILRRSGRLSVLPTHHSPTRNRRPASGTKLCRLRRRVGPTANHSAFSGDKRLSGFQFLLVFAGGASRLCTPGCRTRQPTLSVSAEGRPCFRRDAACTELPAAGPACTFLFRVRICAGRVRVSARPTLRNCAAVLHRRHIVSPGP